MLNRSDSVDNEKLIDAKKAIVEEAEAKKSGKLDIKNAF